MHRFLLSLKLVLCTCCWIATESQAQLGILIPGVNQPDQSIIDIEFPHTANITVPDDVPDANSFIAVDQQPMPINMEDFMRKIGYPPLAKEAGIQGTVVLRLLISPEGIPVKATLLRSPHPILTQAVANSINVLKFKPATKNNTPIWCWVNLPTQFKLSRANSDTQNPYVAGHATEKEYFYEPVDLDTLPAPNSVITSLKHDITNKYKNDKIIAEEITALSSQAINVNFTICIDSSGSPCHILTYCPRLALLEIEIIDSLKKTLKFSPGIKNGKSVNSIYNLIGTTSVEGSTLTINFTESNGIPLLSNWHQDFEWEPNPAAESNIKKPAVLVQSSFFDYTLRSNIPIEIFDNTKTAKFIEFLLLIDENGQPRKALGISIDSPIYAAIAFNSLSYLLYNPAKSKENKNVPSWVKFKVQLHY